MGIEPNSNRTNRTRTDIQKNNVELEPNRTEPVNVLCNLKGDLVRPQYYLYKKPTQRQSKVMTI